MQSQSTSDELQLVKEFSLPPADHDNPQFQLSPCRAVYLPSELIQDIHKSCDKKTLKSVRLTCRDWNHAVIPLLFDRVFISAREKDLKVFHSITECEHLAANIKELHIDATGASASMDEGNYAVKLVDQLAHLLSRLPLSAPDSEPLRVIRLRTMEYRILFNITKIAEPSDCRSRVEFRAVKDSEDMEETLDGFKEVVRESHAAYLAMAETEEELLRSKTGLMSKLQLAVKRLIRLESVIIDDGIWKMHPQEKFPTFDPGLWYDYGFGPPAARVRNPMQLQPSPYIPNGTLAASLFEVVAGALAVSPRPLRCIRISSNQNAGFMPSPIRCRPLDSWLSTDSCSALEYLELNIQHQDWGTSTTPTMPGRISSLLRRNQSSLRRTRLELGGYFHYRTGEPPRMINPYPFQSIFKKGLHMPNLVALSLGAIALSAYELIDLLRLHCPKLRELAIGDMHLTYGNWPGLLAMFKGLKLDRFHMSKDAAYWQRPNGFCGSHETKSGVYEKGPCPNISEVIHYVLGGAIYPHYQEYLWKGNLREYHRHVMSAIVCCWPESMRKSVIDDYHAAIGTIQVPLESRLNLDWDAMSLTSLLSSPAVPPGHTIKRFMLQNT